MFRLIASCVALSAVALLMGSAGFAASSTVPPTSAGNHTQAVTVNDKKPPECAGITLTALVSGTGTFSGTAAAELILGSSGVDSISGSGGNDCIVGGDGNDTINGNGGNDVILGGWAPTG